MTESPKRLSVGGGVGPQADTISRLLSQLPKDSWDSPAREGAARESVWRRLQGRKQDSRSLGWILASSCALAAALLLFWGWRPTRPAVGQAVLLDELPGSVQVDDAVHGWHDIGRGEGLSLHSQVRTGRGWAIVGIPGIAQVRLDADSELSLAAVGTETLVNLEKGGLLAQVTKRPAGASFTVVLHGYQVRVVGTIFSVSEGEGGAVLVHVAEGVVEVEHGGDRSWRVSAGQSWSSAAEESARQEPATGPAKPAPFPGGESLPPRASELSPLKRAATSSAPAVRTGSLPTAVPRVSAQSGLVSASSPLLPARPTVPGSPPGSVVPDARGPEPASPARSTVAAQSGAALPPVAQPVPAAGGLYARAAELSAQKRYAEAAGALQTLVDSKGPHDDLALYELGRLRQSKLGDMPGAVEAFDRYRTLYPAGPLAEEATLSIIEADLAQSRFDRATAEAKRFLTEHPDSGWTDEVYLLRGNALRQSQRCPEAIDDYSHVRDPHFADDAAYFTAWCQARLGQATAARGSLKAYLERFPAGRHADEARGAAGSGD